LTFFDCAALPGGRNFSQLRRARLARAGLAIERGHHAVTFQNKTTTNDNNTMHYDVHSACVMSSPSRQQPLQSIVQDKPRCQCKQDHCNDNATTTNESPTNVYGNDGDKLTVVLLDVSSNLSCLPTCLTHNGSSPPSPGGRDWQGFGQSPKTRPRGWGYQRNFSESPFRMSWAVAGTVLFYLLAITGINGSPIQETS
jgi:hypothetical protein